MHTEQELELTEFEKGLLAQSASNGKYYICTDYYGMPIKKNGHFVLGKVKLANPPKKVSFIDLEFHNQNEVDEYMENPVREVEYNNTRHLYWKIKELYPDVTVAFTKGRVYVNGYKICFRIFGYNIYDRYKKMTVNEVDDNSDYFDSDSVMAIVENTPDEERMTSIIEANEKRKGTIFLRSYKDYKNYVLGKTESPVIKTENTATSPEDKYESFIQEFIEGKLPSKKLKIRFKKMTGGYIDSGKRLLNFFILVDKFKEDKISGSELKSGIMDLL